MSYRLVSPKQAALNFLSDHLPAGAAVSSLSNHRVNRHLIRLYIVVVTERTTLNGETVSYPRITDITGRVSTLLDLSRQGDRIASPSYTAREIVGLLAHKLHGDTQALYYEPL